MKTLIVGDVHGCYVEFMDLLGVAGLSKGDKVIFLGDVFDRGPENKKLLNLLDANRTYWTSLLGNHERKHLRHLREGAPLSSSQRLMKREFSEEEYNYALWIMTSFPASIELENAILAHGFFEPGIPLAEQQERVLVGTFSAERYLKSRYSKPFYELYTGDKPLIVGHLDYLETGEPLIWKDKVFCLDTGCCFGQRLTGLLLPEFKLISVKSKKNYWAEARLSAQIPEAVSDKKARGLFERVMVENARIVAALDISCGYHALSANEQGKAYAGYIPGHPLRKLLQRARKGLLTIKDVRQCLAKTQRIPE